MNRESQIIMVLTLLMGVAAILASGCGPASQEVPLTAHDNGRQIEIHRGQALNISLPGNPSTGYIWQLDEVDEQILLQKGKPNFEPKSNEVGAPGLQTFRFQAVETGETILRLVYRRPWEDDVKPLQVFSIRVSVR